MTAASNRIDDAMAKLRSSGSRALIPFISAGDPSLGITEELVLAFDAAGADVVELGVPFSDPIADGPSIQRSSERALETGAGLAGILECVERVRRTSDIPIVLMTYYNPAYRYGVREFCAAASAAGVDGLIVPDLPPEEADELLPPAREHGLATIFLVAPTSTPERMRLIAKTSTGFIYAVSLTGVTGARDVISEDLRPMLDRLRALTDKPICVGFGISGPEQAQDVARLADGAIVGSAIVNTVEAHLDRPERIVPATRDFVRNLVDAVKSVDGRPASPPSATP